jgi:hypothetical protein
LGANVLFQSLDGGKTWKAISNDLTRNDKTKQIPSGSPLAHDISGAEDYDTILSIVIAPTDPKVIWVGTDDGYVQVTRDGGKTWANVTAHIPGAPEWARVYKIGVSPFDAGTAFVSFDAHMLGDRRAYVYKTSDYGQTWQSIASGLPESPVFVVGEDPNQRGFLALGNDRGLFYSRDAGAHWHKWTAHFPTVPVFDLRFDRKTHDVIVATHGRGLFVFDDIRPFEQLTQQIASGDFHVFQAGTGILYHHWQADEGQPTSFSVPNAPSGVPIDYLLKAKIEPSAEQEARHETPVKIVISDSAGNVVATHYGPSNAGINRFIWDMRYSGTRRLASAVRPEPGAPPRARFFTRGPLVLPGEYKVAVTVDGKTQATTVTIESDPNLHIPESKFRAIAQAALQERNQFDALNVMIERLHSMKQQLEHFRQAAQREPALEQKYAPLLSQAKSLEKKIDSLSATVYNPNIQHNVAEDGIHAFTDFHGQLRDMAEDLSTRYGEVPNARDKERMAYLSKQLRQHLQAFHSLINTDLAAYNKAAHAAGAPTLFAGPPVVVKPAPEPFGKT